MPNAFDTYAALRAHALTLPGAWEDYPWGERVMKVGKKVFIFMGRESELEAGLGFAVKLPTSGAELLTRPYAEPTGYGLGKSGWVSLRYPPEASPDLAEIRAWTEESWAAIAPKRAVNAFLKR